MSVPHEVPSGALPAAVHTGWPVVQEIFIAWQEFAGVQSLPAAHAAHMPLLHTSFVPQLVPSSTLPVVPQNSGPFVGHS
jgi:hypothetical protein